MIVMKQSSIADQCGSIDYPLNGTKFNHDIETECEIRPVNLSLTSLKSMGICVFAYLSHCNVLAIFAEVRGPSRSGVLKRMEKGNFWNNDHFENIGRFENNGHFENPKIFK